MSDLHSTTISQPPQPVKKILIDTTFLFDQFSKRGIGRYGKEVLKRLTEYALEDPTWEVHWIGFLNLNQNLIQLNLSQFTIEGLLNKIHFHSIGEPQLSSISNIFRWFKYYRPVIYQIKPDIYYAIHFERGLPSTTLLKTFLDVHPKTVVMAHDAIPIATNSYSSKGFFTNIIKGLIYNFMFSGVRNADIVLTNSNFSKGDIIKYGHVNPDKIHTIYLGITELFFRENNKNTKEEIDSILNVYEVKDQKYFFYDSGIEANKGIHELLEIFKKLSDFNSPAIPNKLVIVGGDFLKGAGQNIKARTEKGKKVLNEMKKLNILNNIVTTDKIQDEDLQILLFNASVYINFAKYEGFLFGPVQAMAAEIPGIASNTSCTPEVTSGGAFLVDLNNLDEAAQKIKQFLEDKSRIEEQVKKGKEVAKKYNWDDTAHQTWQLIKSLK